VTIRIVAFARVREVLGAAERTLQLKSGASAGDAWSALVAQRPELAGLARSTRLARNGRIVPAQEALLDGDELSLLPPSGGG
jgi:molybdopterin converting factor small subunit